MVSTTFNMEDTMSVIDRLDDIIARLSEGTKNPDVAIALKHGSVPIPGIIHTLELYRNEISNLNEKRIAEINIFGGLGKRMMEDMDFCYTSLGMEIIYLESHLCIMQEIDQAMLEMERSWGKPVDKPGWKQLYQVLVDMQNSFDANWVPNETRLSQLRSTMDEVVEKYQLPIHGSELGDTLYHLH